MASIGHNESTHHSVDEMGYHWSRFNVEKCQPFCGCINVLNMLDISTNNKAGSSETLKQHAYSLSFLANSCVRRRINHYYDVT